MNPTPRRFLLACCLAVALGGCAQWKGGPFAKRAAPGAGDRPWEPHVVKLRVYPSSGLVQVGADALLEARIELLDDMDDSLKASGRYHFELALPAGAGAIGSSNRLYAWDVAVLTRREQEQFYDPITRAYLFRLKLDHPLDHQVATVLRLTMTTPGGEQFSVESPLGK
jgi:hypothetical protein